MGNTVIQSLSDNQFSIEQAVHSAARRLRAANVEQETAAGIVLAIIEALGNIARHATRPLEPLKFELDQDYETDDERVIILATD